MLRAIELLENKNRKDTFRVVQGNNEASFRSAGKKNETVCRFLEGLRPLTNNLFSILSSPRQSFSGKSLYSLSSHRLGRLLLESQLTLDRLKSTKSYELSIQAVLAESVKEVLK